MSKSVGVWLAVAALTLCFSLGRAAEGSGDNDLLPAGALDGVAALNAHFGFDSPWLEAVDRAINPDDYDCDLTDFDAWIQETLGDIEPSVLNVLFGYGVLSWATYYTAFFDHDASDDYIGVDGEYTQELTKRHKDNQRFWDVKTKDILLQGMHGAVIADDAKIVPVVQFLFGVNADIAGAIVDDVQLVLENSIGYDHPLLTLNAFAFSAEGEEIPGIGDVDDKIVMGEGLLEALDDMGLGKNGPDFVHSHEFAHHVQFELGAFDPFDPTDPDQPEKTRRTELMADAFSSYYLAHKRGATWQKRQIKDALASAYVVGDCQFGSPQHHGTPNQREASADWGADVAMLRGTHRRGRGHILPSETLLELFDDELPDLVAPDAN